MSKQTKYEYDIVDADYGYLVTDARTREQARQIVRECKQDCPEQRFVIIQHKYTLQHSLVVR